MGSPKKNFRLKMLSQLPLPVATQDASPLLRKWYPEKKKPRGLPVTISLKELKVAPICRKERISGGPGQRTFGNHLSNAHSLHTGQALEQSQKDAMKVLTG